MDEEELTSLLHLLLDYGKECEWIEFKNNNASESVSTCQRFRIPQRYTIEMKRI